MKRWIAFLLIVAMGVCLAGCQKEEEKEDTAAEKYSRAQTLMSKSRFAEAAAAFDKLGSYEESAKLSMYCKAADCGEKGDYDTAIAAFESLGDYKESLFMITYYRARKKESGSSETAMVNDIPDAIRLYDSIPLFRDSRERAEICRKVLYDWAVRKAENGDFTSACSMLGNDELAGYSDSQTLRIYYFAFLQEMNGHYVEASDTFSSLGDYRDAAAQATRVLRHGYEKAEALEASGDLNGACEAFLDLGDYSDSADRANKLIYLRGEKLRDAGDWEGAAKAFSSLGTYHDAQTQVLATYYAEGITKRDDKDLDGAIAAFEKAQSYEDAAAQIDTIRKQQAQQIVDTAPKERLRQVLICWSINDLDQMVELCLPSWRVKQENAKKELFTLLQNRTLIGNVDLLNEPDQNGDSRDFILQVTISRNDGQEPTPTQMTIRMVIENGVWYVDPESLKSDEIQGTPDPNAKPVVTPTPEPYTDGNTVLYYNPDGGKLYHRDANCISVHSKYTPMKGTFTYSQINDGKYAELEPCNVCGAPLRNR